MTNRFRTTVSAAAMAVLAMPLAAAVLHAQERPARFQRRQPPVELPVTVFHSTQAANLPTAETLRRGEWLFEISHRFHPAVSEGADALWGFDGPAINRLGLSWAATDRLMLGVLRSSLADNLELNAKIRLWETRRGEVSWMVGAMGGAAWNTDAPTALNGVEENEFQGYVQAMVNVAFGKRVALGLVPTLLRNPDIEAPSAETVLVVGGHGQIYLSDQVSLLAEWIKSRRRPGLEYDSGTFGIELETGGHFFKIVLTNQERMNPTQFLGGTPYEFRPGEWRVGFNITRLLAFGD